MRKIVVTGGTGFIGTPLVVALRTKGYNVTIIARNAPSGSNSLSLDLSISEPPTEVIEGVEAVIHLAGANIFRRWNKEVKKTIYTSRINSTRNLINALNKTKTKPKCFISASAVGYYGNRDEIPITEKDPAGHDFLAQVCRDWEDEALKAAELGIRTVCVRTAPVIGKGGGLVQLLRPIYQLGLGGPLGNGRQWFPWVHHADIVAIYLFVLEHATLQKAVNACSASQIRYEEFSSEFAKIIKKPNWLRTPKPLLKLAIGELAEAVLISQKVLPAQLLLTGYQFKYPSLTEALKEALN